jgi:hypothetical protein
MLKNIEFRSIFKVIPIPIFWTDKTLKDWQGGYSLGIFCVIRPKYRERNDEGIVEHELEHCRQSYAGLLIFNGLLYKFNAKHRLNAEIEAYALQARVYEKTGTYYDPKRMIKAMAIRYNLPYSEEYIADKFTQYLKEKYDIEI